MQLIPNSGTMKTDMQKLSNITPFSNEFAPPALPGVLAGPATYQSQVLCFLRA